MGGRKLWVQISAMRGGAVDSTVSTIFSGDAEEGGRSIVSVVEVYGQLSRRRIYFSWVETNIVRRRLNLAVTGIGGTVTGKGFGWTVLSNSGDAEEEVQEQFS